MNVTNCTRAGLVARVAEREAQVDELSGKVERLLDEKRQLEEQLRLQRESGALTMSQRTEATVRIN